MWLGKHARWTTQNKRNARGGVFTPPFGLLWQTYKWGFCPHLKWAIGIGDSNPHCLSTEFSQSLPPCRSWRASARLHPYAPKFFAKIQPSRCSQFHISNFFCNKVNYAGNTVVFSRDLLPLQGKLLMWNQCGFESPLPMPECEYPALFYSLAARSFRVCSHPLYFRCRNEKRWARFQNTLKTNTP